ncbi:ParB/RepB/Spo0J family partition protein [Amycolatopsis aidingensis]|uniref:ParB/RepB/Spo0J family partition protein n=1 Tax=Amycolatopsis aidingensis TaxID=2842453 RepID=UPI001C0D2A9E|nr:ParB/RepB/Spo0J family partition protein [Amycolatopsis aidingensis]
MNTAASPSQVGLSPRLRQRRFTLLPLRGEGTPFTEPQGRVPGDSTAPAELADLVSSIATVGVLQPVLVEEVDTGEGQPPVMKLAAGERRLRACRWGAVHRPDNPHFAALPAVVCPGPLSDEERRIWQLVENLAREDLRPGELAAALVLDRCAVLLGKLIAGGHTVPAEVYAIEDPIARFQAMDKLRGTDKECAAPWSEVLTRLGLQLSPRKARELVRAFAEMPREISAEMDEAKISLHTRIRFIELRRGRAAAAEDIWAAVKNTGRAKLLRCAVAAATERDDLTAEQALAEAERQHEEANAARAAALRAPDNPTADRADTGAGDLEEHPVVERQLVDNALAALRALVQAVTAGARLDDHDRASLRLLAEELTAAPAAA